MDIQKHIQQLIDAGIAHYDMEGAVIVNQALMSGSWRMPALNIQINTNCGNTYHTYNFYGDHAAMTDIHENTQSQIH